MNDITKKYPEFKSFTDRRQQSVPVNIDNRSGIDRRKEKREETRIETAMRYAPLSRKALSAFNSFKEGNYIYGIGMLFRLWNERGEDVDDIKTAFKPIKTDQEFQHPFWSVKGCAIEKTKFGEKLLKYDKTLFDLEPVQKFLVKVGWSGMDMDGNMIKFEGKRLAKILGRATLRVPILGAGLFSIIELGTNVPKEDNKLKGVLKSAIDVITIMSMSAISGSIGKPYGKIVEFACMGAGIIAGTKLADKINEEI